MAYLRLDLNYFDTLVVQILEAEYGREAADIPIKIWMFCLRNYDAIGIIPNEQLFPIFDFIGFRGDRDQLLSILLRYKILKDVDGDYEVVDYAKLYAHYRQTLKREFVRSVISPSLRKEVISTGKCAQCGSTVKLTVDHIKPFAKGGKTVRDNLQCLCGLCNSAKGAKWPG